MEDRICPACGAKHALAQEHYPMRDRDSLKCPCGETLESWNGSTGWKFWSPIPYGVKIPPQKKPRT